VCGSLDEALRHDLDGVVIATPSGLHPEQIRRALAAGVPVFCQKPLARTAAEARAVVDAARAADRLLGVDLSYRRAGAFESAAAAVRGGDLGRVYAAQAAFHNAYGPDASWSTDAELSGGGCLMDLGIHLVDLVLWTLGWPETGSVDSRLYRLGRRLDRDPDVVEDFAFATFDAGDAAVALGCSWFLDAGCDAVISAAFYGTDGSVEVRNVGGSFYDFKAELHRGTRTEMLAEPPDAWGGRTLIDWAQRLCTDPGFDEEAERTVRVAALLDAMYGRSG
jgi:predicted dehydrogenase